MSASPFKVSFIHRNNPLTKKDKKKLEARKLFLTEEQKSFTECTICNGETFVSSGKAVLYYKDNFCREMGRKISLKRALLNTDLNKEERRQIWVEVLGMLYSEATPQTPA